MTTLLFVVTLLVSLIALAGLLKVRRTPLIIVPWFAMGWFAAEMPLWLVSVQILLIICQLVFTTIDTTPEQLTMMIALWNCAALIHSQKKHQLSATKLLDEFKHKTGLTTQSFTSGQSWQKPFDFKRPGVKIDKHISYGDDPLQTLDIYRPSVSTSSNMPILLQIHGGAWIIGDKAHQALPLINTMAERGWCCISCNYRLGPTNRWPAMIDDVELCLQWIKHHAAEYNLDPDFICVTGGSAGGHLSAIAALRNPHIKAAVPLYGIYDFLDSQALRGPVSMQGFLEKSVMPCKLDDNEELWKNASPLFVLQPQQMPNSQSFLILHGTHDSLALSEEAELFANEMDKAGYRICYLEVDNAQHAFDLIWSERTRATVEVISSWLEHKLTAYYEEKQQKGLD